MLDLPGFFTAASATAKPLYVFDQVQFSLWREQQFADIQAWLDSLSFTAAPGTAALLPGDLGASGAVLGIDDPTDPYAYAHGPLLLPRNSLWQLANTLDTQAQASLHLGWGLSSYRFSRYRQRLPALALLAAQPDAETAALLTACLRVRDWINTPAEDMGPTHLEAIARELAAIYAAEIEVIADDDLLRRNFPAIHAVGRASHRPPRLIILRWGQVDAPHVALVGKGVCFDSGGLDIKPASGMRQMKKDMGGAAHVLALAGLVMAQSLPLRLSVAIPAVDNAIGPHAFRPGDIIRTRKGLGVEIDNTDAEGRLILGDALTWACEQNPDLVIDFATLTGAARIALGPDLPALFANDETLAQQCLDASMKVHDPLWRLPLWPAYRRYLSSSVADMANAGSRMAGAITAALYLQHFINTKQRWAHIDVYAWNDHDRPGRPLGGESQGLRAVWQLLKTYAH